MHLTGFSIPITLTDDAGNTLFGVTVGVTGPGGYSSTTTASSTTGAVRLGPLPLGDYTVTYAGRSITVPVIATATDIVAEAVATVSPEMVTSAEIDLIRQLTLAQYDALVTKDARTLYVII